jgi:hypothetical protein
MLSPPEMLYANHGCNNIADGMKAGWREFLRCYIRFADIQVPKPP